MPSVVGYTQEDREAAVARVLAGEKSIRVAREYGMGYSTLRRLVARERTRIEAETADASPDEDMDALVASLPPDEASPPPEDPTPEETPTAFDVPPQEEAPTAFDPLPEAEPEPEPEPEPPVRSDNIAPADEDLEVFLIDDDGFVEAPAETPPKPSVFDAPPPADPAPREEPPNFGNAPQDTDVPSVDEGVLPAWTTPAPPLEAWDGPRQPLAFLRTKGPETERERELRSMIRLYVLHFGEKRLGPQLIGENKTAQRQWMRQNVNEASEEDLERTLAEVQAIVTQRNIHASIRRGFLAGAHVAESLAPYAGLKLQGFTHRLAASPEIDDTLTEIYILNSHALSKYVRPENRLALACVSAAMATDASNRQIESQKRFMEAQISEETMQEYSDL